jgi:hydrogenase nickel incorporation protein HypA/HybF
MHEQSLMRNLLKQVKTIANEHACSEIAEIHVEVGAMSGVEPRLLASAFEQLAVESVFERAEFSIDEIALRAECKSCGHRFHVQEFRFRCPVCESSVRVVCGDQCQLISVSFYQQET